MSTLKAQINRDDLLEALKGLKPFSPSRKSILPILKHVCVTAAGDHLELFATDLDIGMSVQVPGTIEAEGATTLNARDLLAIVAKLPKRETIRLSSYDNRAFITCDRTQFHLWTLPLEEFPPKLDGKPEASFEIPSDLLAAAIRHALPYPARDSKSIISGLMLQIRDRQLTVAATDGYRLATWTAAVDAEGSLRVTVPRGFMKELARHLGKAETVQVELKDPHATFTLGSMSMVTRLVDGQYPAYESIIPKLYAHVAIVDRAELKAAIARLMVITSKDYAYLIAIAMGNGEITLTAKSRDKGEASTSISVEGGQMDLTFEANAAYLLQALTTMKSEKVRLLANSRHAMFMLVDPDDSRPQYLQMPIRS